MAALSAPRNFLMDQENQDMGTAEPGIKEMAAGNGKAAEAKGAGAAKKGRKIKKEDDKREDLLAALLDRRSYFASEEKRTQQKKGMISDESDINEVHANGRSAEITEETTKKSHKNKRAAENGDDFLAALSDRRSYFVAQEKRSEQMKAVAIVEPDIQHGGAEAVQKRSKSKKEAENVCIII